ncbi:MAG TPA: hypothetical protein PL070_20720 [Flavobacteriales bacterium]|nr:hypothetical protein [Flavobacteriales bacterium]
MGSENDGRTGYALGEQSKTEKSVNGLFCTAGSAFRRVNIGE